MKYLIVIPLAMISACANGQTSKVELPDRNSGKVVGREGGKTIVEFPEKPDKTSEPTKEMGPKGSTVGERPEGRSNPNTASSNPVTTSSTGNSTTSSSAGTVGARTVPKLPSQVSATTATYLNDLQKAKMINNVTVLTQGYQLFKDLMEVAKTPKNTDAREKAWDIIQLFDDDRWAELAENLIATGDFYQRVGPRLCDDAMTHLLLEIDDARKNGQDASGLQKEYEFWKKMQETFNQRPVKTYAPFSAVHRILKENFSTIVLYPPSASGPKRGLAGENFEKTIGVIVGGGNEVKIKTKIEDVEYDFSLSFKYHDGEEFQPVPRMRNKYGRTYGQLIFKEKMDVFSLSNEDIFIYDIFIPLSSFQTLDRDMATWSIYCYYRILANGIPIYESKLFPIDINKSDVFPE